MGRLDILLPASALVAGARVDRRLLGPVSLGAFALVPLARPLEPTVGASLSVEW